MTLLSIHFRRYCPHCGSDRIRRSARRGFFERGVLPLLSAYPYRCEKCYCRTVMFIGRRGVREVDDDLKTPSTNPSETATVAETKVS